MGKRKKWYTTGEKEGGAAVKGKKEEMPREEAALLQCAAGEKSVPGKRKYLLQAEALFPESLALQKELLLLGEEAEGWKSLKCFLLHAFEHPEMHTEEEEKSMAREIFSHPRLEKCLRLSPDPQAFMQAYLSAICGQYIEIFIENQREHVPGLLGYVMPGRLRKYFALPMGDVIRNIFLCPFLSAEEQSLLAGVFYRACFRHLNGQTDALDGQLGEEIRALIR